MWTNATVGVWAAEAAFDVSQLPQWWLIGLGLFCLGVLALLFGVVVYLVRNGLPELWR